MSPTVPSSPRIVPPGRVALLWISLLVATSAFAQEARSPEPPEAKPASTPRREGAPRPASRRDGKGTKGAKATDPLDSRQLMGLDWRSIGPPRVHRSQ